MDLIDIPISSDELYRLEKQRLIIKDYELIAICTILNIDYKELEKIIFSYYIEHQKVKDIAKKEKECY